MSAGRQVQVKVEAVRFGKPVAAGCVFPSMLSVGCPPPQTSDLHERKRRGKGEGESA